MDSREPTVPNPPDPTPVEVRHLGAVEHERLRQSVYRRVFGASSPVEVGRFTVLERIGSGGMGLVFKAYDMQLDRKVAVKVIRVDGESEAARRALVKEARALARLSHPNVVHVYEVGEGQGGQVYLAMEFVDGLTLREWVARAQRTWREIVEVGLQAAEGLAAAHAAGLVHRDFKPDNVMVGDDARVRVLDFGLAHADASAPAGPPAAEHMRIALNTTIDRIRGVAGTPAYMAPEQIDAGTIGPAADQFAFCAALFEVLYGVRPFDGATLAELRAAIGAGRLTVPSDRCGVPKPLHRAIVQGLAADPGDRHASMQVLIGEIRRARLGQRMRRWAPAAAVGVALASAGFALIPRDAPPVPETTAQDDELVLARAEKELATDPSTAVGTLAGLSASAAVWSDRAFVVAEQADLHGLPDRELELEPAFAMLGIAGHRVVGYRAAEQAIVATSVLDGSTQTLIVDVAVPPSPPPFLVSDRPIVQIDDQARFVALEDQGVVTIVGLDSGRTTVLPAGPNQRGLAFSLDGTVVAVRLDDRIAVHRLPEGERIAEVPVPGGDDTRRAEIALDRAGTRVATAIAGGSVMIHRVADGTVVELPKTDAAKIAFAGDDSLVVTGVVGGAQLWDLAKGESETLGWTNIRHVSLALARDGEVVVTATGDDLITVRDLADDRLHGFPGGESPVVSRDGQHVAWVTAEGRVRVLDLASMTEQLLAMDAPIVEYGFTADSTGVVAYADNRRARHWPLAREATRLVGHTETITDLAFVPDTSVLFSVARDRTLRRWDLDAGTSAIFAKVSDPYGVDVSRDGRFVATSSSGGVAEVWRTDDGELVHRTEPGYFGAKFQGSSIYVASEDAIRRIELESGTETEVVTRAGCQGFAIDDEGTRLAAACSEHVRAAMVQVFGLPSGRPIATDVVADWRVLAFLDRDHLLGGPFVGSLSVIDTRTGERERIGSARRWTDVSLDAERRTLAIADGEVGIELYDTAARSSALVPGTDDAFLVAIASDGRSFAYTRDRRAITVHTRRVPRDPAELRTWVQEHQVVHTRAR